MKAGKLDRRISILRRGEPVDDGYQTVPGELGILCVRWASWKAANGREVYENMGREAKSAGTFWLRYDATTSGIVETDIVVWEGRTWDIESVTQLGRMDGIELLVVADDEQSEIDLTGLSPLLADGGDGIEIVGNELRVDIDSLPEG